LQLRGDIGGFGVGSDFSWQLFGRLQISIHRQLERRYRLPRAFGRFGEDSANETRGIDLIQHGPVFGMSYRW
jgi:hypothetical protein